LINVYKRPKKGFENIAKEFIYKLYYFINIIISFSTNKAISIRLISILIVSFKKCNKYCNFKRELQAYLSHPSYYTENFPSVLAGDLQILSLLAFFYFYIWNKCIYIYIYIYIYNYFWNECVYFVF